MKNELAVTPQAPPDNCPRCMVITCIPLRMRPAGDWEGIIADYTCTGCDHRWWTSWSTYDLDLPPGLLAAVQAQADPPREGAA